MIMTQNKSRPKAVIVGANFSGLKAAIHLPSRKFDVTVIDKRPWFEFLPNIHELVSGMKSPGMLRFSTESMIERAGHKFIPDTVVKISPDEQQVATESGKTLSYDYCVVAAGADDNTFGVKGADVHACPFNRIADCDRIGQKLKALSKSGQPFFAVIAGGGFEGVEALGEILRAYRNHKGLHVRMIEKQSKMLHNTPGDIDSEIRRHCGPYPVEFLTGETLKEVAPDSVILSNGKRLKSDLTIWNGGLRPLALYRASGFTQSPDEWPKTDEFLRHHEFSNVFFTGDAASTPDALPKQAYHALDMGKHAALNLVRSASGRPLKPFKPSLKPLLIAFGDLDTFMIAGNTVVAGTVLSALKESVFHLVMTRLDPSGVLRKPLGLSVRAGESALRFVMANSLSPGMLLKLGDVRLL